MAPRALRRRPLDEKAREALTRRQANLSALSKHPSWPDLEEEVERKAARIEKVVLGKVLTGTPRDEINVMELQWLKGFVAGMRWFADVPVKAESSLLSYLESQGIRTEGRDE